MRMGATLLGERCCRFELWAPKLDSVHLELLGPRGRGVAMTKDARGVHRAELDGVEAGTRYRYRCGERHFADPASRFQPEGVHGPSAIVGREFAWTDGAWSGRAWRDAVIYEMHVGTFTAGGTFDAAIAELDGLVALGFTVVEPMPIAQFPGARNWGYDGVFPFAVAASYGGPDAFRRFVDACHARGLAVVLDVVYNHFGPEGAVFDQLAPYHNASFSTPWGAAMNFDGPGSDGVRRYFLDNAQMWLDEYHVDGLRLDAVHGIVDRSAMPFLSELVTETAALGRVTWPRWLVAEDDRNDPRLVRPLERGGLGLDAVWADDFHHALHVLVTGESSGYYADYTDPALLARAIQEGFAYTGGYSPSRDRRHGAPATDVPPEAFVVCGQNHDQIGNRLRGERLTALASDDAVRCALAMVLLSPHTPLVFMGEEHGETRPFLYFTDHGDPELAEAVRRGRKAEFAAFDWSEEPPDPQAAETMARCVLQRHRDGAEQRRALVAAALAVRQRGSFTVGRADARVEMRADGRLLFVQFPPDLCAIFHLGSRAAELDLELGVPWRVVLDGADPRFGGSGRVLGDRVDAGSRALLPPWWFAVIER